MTPTKALASPWERAQGVLEAVCEVCDVEPEALFWHDRAPEHVRPRLLAMYVMRESLALTFKEIGNVLGRDHSTVLSGCRRIVYELSRDEELVELLVRVVALYLARCPSQ